MNLIRLLLATLQLDRAQIKNTNPLKYKIIIQIIIECYANKNYYKITLI